MSFELLIARRYLRGHSRTAGGALTSAIAVGGVAVGVAALVVTLAVMTGFREDIRAKILGAQPHLLVMGAGGAMPEGEYAGVFHGAPGVEAWSPFVMGQALARKGAVTQGVIVKGVDPAREPAVTGLADHLREGRWKNLAERRSPTEVPVLLGKELAKTLHAGLGDTVILAAPGGAGASLMGGLPALYTFTVDGVFETGLYDYDSSLAVIPLDAAQRVFELEGQVTGLGVRLADPDDPDGAAMVIQKSVGAGVWVRSWLSMNRNLFAALKLEKTVMFVILALITLVAAFTIVSNLLLVTAQRVHEIGILRAMGAPRGAIERIFLLKGLMMGAMGTAFGVGLGLAISAVLTRYQFVQLPADVYYVDRLPVKVLPGDVGAVAGAALVIVLLATLYPARLAAKLDALDAIRRV